MELTSINTIRERYRSLLSADERYNTVLQALCNKQDTDPILNFTELNGESDLSYSQEQRQLSEILLDMHALNNGMIELKDTIRSTVDTLEESVEAVLRDINKQTEQAEDSAVICGQDSVYSSVIPIFTSDFISAGQEILDEKAIGAALITLEEVPYDIVSISGNGYSGNSFVYNGGAFENETDDRSSLEYIMDANDVTVYEYSRLSTKDKKEAVSGVINYDDKEVECVLTLSAQRSVCKAMIRSDDTGLVVKDVETSQDGITFTSYGKKELYINDVEQSYEDPDYVYGSGILCFPYAPYVRITLASNTVLDDTIAIETEDGEVQIRNAYRKKIALKGISLMASEYEDMAAETGNILEDSAIDKISLFASEYIPDHFSTGTYIEYYLILNGQEYPVVPVNAGRDGITIVKYSEEASSPNANTELIHETIKTVRLKLVIHTFKDRETPYVSNLKICVGKNTGNIYV